MRSLWMIVAAVGLMVAAPALAEPQKVPPMGQKAGAGEKGGPRMGQGGGPRFGPGGRPMGPSGMQVRKGVKGGDAPAPDFSGKAGAPQANERQRAMLGNNFLQRGNYRAAAAAFRRQLEEDPTANMAHIGLGRALAKMGQCEEALDELWPFVGMKVFNAEAALTAASCSSKLGFSSDALYFDQMAVDLDPKNTRALTALALELDLWGDADGAAAILEELETINKGDKDASLFAGAVMALRKGDMERLDSLLMLWKMDERSYRDIAPVVAQSWLDMDDPISAIQAIQSIKRVRKGGDSRRIQAEAWRRLGYPDQADTFLKDSPNVKMEGQVVDVIQARIRIDEGDLSAAKALLEPYEGSVDPDTIATFWYLARAEKDDALAKKLEVLYKEYQVSPLRTLELLVPIPARPPQ